MCDRLFPISQLCHLHSLVLCFSACQQSNRDKSVHMPSSSCLGKCRKDLLTLFDRGLLWRCSVRTWTHTGIFLSDYGWHRQSICLCFFILDRRVSYDNARAV